MTAPAGGEIHEQTGDGRPGRRDRRRSAWRPILAGAALALLIIFAFENTTKVKISWVFFDSENSLIAVIVVSAVLGALVGQLFALRRRRRAARR